MSGPAGRSGHIARSVQEEVDLFFGERIRHRGPVNSFGGFHSRGFELYMEFDMDKLVSRPSIFRKYLTINDWRREWDSNPRI